MSALIPIKHDPVANEKALAGIRHDKTRDANDGFDGGWVARLDMGWTELKVAIEYDGGHHYTDRRQYLKDIRRLEKLQELGWIVVRVVAEDRPEDVIRRVRNALDSRAGMRRG